MDHESKHLSATMLQSWISGDLSEEQSAELETHMEVCQTCAQLYETLPGVADPLLTRLREALNPPDIASADFNLRIGALAIQAGLITAQQFADSAVQWSSNNSLSLGDFFVEQGWMNLSVLEELQSLAKHQADSARDSQSTMATFVYDPDSVVNVNQQEVDVPGSDDASEEFPNFGADLLVKRLHSSGTFGNIWVARDQILGRNVAVKELRSEYSDSEQFKQRFIREARAASQLVHPGIVPVYGFHDDGGKCYYTMRFVEGDRMTDVIAKHFAPNQNQDPRVGLIELLKCTLSIIDTVAFAHSLDVIHRDLKSDNIVIGSFGEVIVLDWGLVKQLGDEPKKGASGTIRLDDPDASFVTAHGQRLGTPAFMSPEQARGDAANIDERSDVYSLGAILYEVLCGQPPFNSSNVLEVMEQLQNEEPPMPTKICPTVPVQLEWICLKALAKDPTSRYQTAADMGTEIRKWLASRVN